MKHIIVLTILILFSFHSSLTIMKKHKKPKHKIEFIVIFRCLDSKCSDHKLYENSFLEYKTICNEEYQPNEPIEKQALAMFEFIKQNKKENEIFIDLFGFSIGGITARYIVQFYYDKLKEEGIIINNLVTFGSPHIGTFKASQSDILNFIAGSLHNHLSPISDLINAGSQVFLKESNFKFYDNKFLRKINGIIFDDNTAFMKDETRIEFLKTFEKLNKIILIRYTKDTVINPSYSAWFMYNKDIFNPKSIDLTKDHIDFMNNKVIDISKLRNYNTNLLAKEKLQFTFEDNIGMNDLFNSGKLILVNFSFNHLNEDWMRSTDLDEILK